MIPEDWLNPPTPPTCLIADSELLGLPVLNSHLHLDLFCPLISVPHGQTVNCNCWALCDFILYLEEGEIFCPSIQLFSALKISVLILSNAKLCPFKFRKILYQNGLDYLNM